LNQRITLLVAIGYVRGNGRRQIAITLIKLSKFLSSMSYLKEM
jgi:hypothetical protein